MQFDDITEENIRGPLLHRTSADVNILQQKNPRFVKCVKLLRVFCWESVAAVGVFMNRARIDDIILVSNSFILKAVCVYA